MQGANILGLDSAETTPPEFMEAEPLEQNQAEASDSQAQEMEVKAGDGDVDVTQPQPAPASVEPVAPPVPKPKKDRLARLRELGVEPPPVSKLCADDGSFDLEPPQVNPGESTTKNSHLCNVNSLAQYFPYGGLGFKALCFDTIDNSMHVLDKIILVGQLKPLL